MNTLDTVFQFLSHLSVSEWRKLSRRLFRNGLNVKQIQVIETELFKARYSNRYSHASRWMENKLSKDFSITPYRLASIYVNVTSGNKRLLPYYIKLAQRIKLRLYARKKRREEGKVPEGQT